MTVHRAEGLLRLRLLALVCGLSLCACRGRAPTDTPATVSPNPTLSSSSTPSRTARVGEMTPTLPSPTVATVPNPVLPPTLTPRSTLPPDQAQALVLDLLETNGGCQLPCWWGLRPGVTEWATAYNFLNTLALEIRSTAVTRATVFFQFPDINGGNRFQHDYGIRDGIIDIIHPQIVTREYDLPEALTTLGQPTVVQIRTFSATSEGILPLYLVLTYADQGIVISYTTESVLDGAILRGCPQDGSHDPLLWLWSPNGDPQTMTQIGESAYGVGEADFYLSIEEATNLTIQDFYRLFNDQENAICLETPASLWQ
jgi:hypothetical protein